MNSDPPEASPDQSQDLASHEVVTCNGDPRAQFLMRRQRSSGITTIRFQYKPLVPGIHHHRHKQVCSALLEGRCRRIKGGDARDCWRYSAAPFLKNIQVFSNSHFLATLLVAGRPISLSNSRHLIPNPLHNHHAVHHHHRCRSVHGGCHYRRAGCCCRGSGYVQSDMLLLLFILLTSLQPRTTECASPVTAQQLPRSQAARHIWRCGVWKHKTNGHTQRERGIEERINQSR
jgi:hypothetical protein